MDGRRGLNLGRPGWSRYRIVLWLLASLTFAISVILVPYLFERHDDAWIERLGGAARPLTLFERYVQFDVDTLGWVKTTAGFPGYYAENPTRINRPLYPLMGTLLPRLVTIAAHLPDLGQGLARRANEALTFASLLAINYVLFNLGVQIFFTWLLRLRRFSLGVSFMAAAMLAVSPWALVQCLKPTPNVFGMVTIVIILYLFDRYLLAEESPGWRPIVWVSLLAGVLMLGKAQYDALFLVWLGALSRRRWRVLFGSAVIHLVPLAIWVALVTASGQRFYNYEVEVYHQGFWLLEVIRAGGLSEVYYLGMSFTATALGGLVRTFTLLDLSLAGYALVFRQTAFPAGFARLFAFGLLAVLALVVLIARPLPYLIFDMFVVTYPLVAAGLLDLIRRLREALHAPAQIGRRLTAWLVALFFAFDVPIGWVYLSLDRETYAWHPALSSLLDLFR